MSDLNMEKIRILYGDMVGIEKNVLDLLKDVQEKTAVLEGFRGDIENALNAAISSLPSAATHEMERAGASVISSLAERVGKIAQQVAGDAAAAEKNKTFCLALVLTVIGCSACVALGFGAGRGWNKLEVNNILEEAQTRVAAAEKNIAWLQSDDGKAAMNLVEMGFAKQLNDCSRPGWRVLHEGALGLGHTNCIPHVDENLEMYGWKIKD